MAGVNKNTPGDLQGRIHLSDSRHQLPADGPIKEDVEACEQELLSVLESEFIRIGPTTPQVGATLGVGADNTTMANNSLYDASEPDLELLGPSDAPGDSFVIGTSNLEDPFIESRNAQPEVNVRHLVPHLPENLPGFGKLSENLRQQHKEFGDVVMVRPAGQLEQVFERPFNFDTFLRIVGRFYPVVTAKPVTQEHYPVVVGILASKEAIATGDDHSFGIYTGKITPEVKRRELAKFNDEVVPYLDNETQVLAPGEQIPPNIYLKIIRIFDNIWMQDGRYTGERTLWLRPKLENGNTSSLEGYLKNGFDLPIGFMQKVRELLGKDTVDAHIEVDRCKREWLLWERKMDLTQFYTNISWKIDHPIINVYPRDWSPSKTFENSYEEVPQVQPAAAGPNNIQGTEVLSDSQRPYTMGSDDPNAGPNHLQENFMQIRRDIYVVETEQTKFLTEQNETTQRIEHTLERVTQQNLELRDTISTMLGKVEDNSTDLRVIKTRLKNLNNLPAKSTGREVPRSIPQIRQQGTAQVPTPGAQGTAEPPGDKTPEEKAWAEKRLYCNKCFVYLGNKPKASRPIHLKDCGTDWVNLLDRKEKERRQINEGSPQSAQKRKQNDEPADGQATSRTDRPGAEDDNVEQAQGEGTRRRRSRKRAKHGEKTRRTGSSRRRGR